MILDGIHYNLYVKNVHIASGDIGTEAPEDIIRSQNGFPVIANMYSDLEGHTGNTSK